MSTRKYYTKGLHDNITRKSDQVYHYTKVNNYRDTAYKNHATSL